MDISNFFSFIIQNLKYRFLINKGAGYVGMVGSKRKIGLTFNELKDRGVSSEFLKTIHAPIGVDIGAQTVSEIALAIAAQLVEQRRNKKAQPLVIFT